MAKKAFAEKRSAMEVVDGWADDVAADDRWCGWLPEGWTAAVKLTAGGLLIQCVVGSPPERKLFFHKTQLEAYLGRKLGAEDNGKKPGDFGTIDPKQFFHRTERTPSVPYIKARIERLHGQSVEEALSNFTYIHGEGDAAKQKQYSLSDAKYDVEERKFLKLVAERPSQSSHPLPVPSTPAPRLSAPCTPARKRPIPSTPGASSGSAPSTPSTRAPMTPPRPDKKIKTGAVPSTSTNQLAAGSSTSRASGRGGASGISVLGEVFRNCFIPFKSRAASCVADEKSIYTVLGASFSLNLDPTMLKALPEIMRKAPADRGDFGRMTMVQFEKAFAKAADFSVL
jgi:hypothetical protein